MESKKRNMTIKGFCKKAFSDKAMASAMGFLSAHKEYLLSGEVSSITAPIVSDYERGSLTASNALENIRNAVWDHVRATDMEKLHNQIKNDQIRKANFARSAKPFYAKIVDENGAIQTYVNDKGEEKDLENTFDLPQEAKRWCERKLADGANNWVGIIEHKGNDWETITRNQACAEMFRAKRTALHKITGQKAGRLGYNMRVKNDRAYFSQG